MEDPLGRSPRDTPTARARPSGLPISGHFSEVAAPTPHWPCVTRVPGCRGGAGRTLRDSEVGYRVLQDPEVGQGRTLRDPEVGTGSCRTRRWGGPDPAGLCSPVQPQSPSPPGMWV